MSNGVVKHSQFKGSTYFSLKEPVLQRASFVTIRKGDLTARFSVLAEKLMQDMDDVDVEVQIEKSTHDGNQRITVRRLGPDVKALTPDELESFKEYMEDFLANEEVKGVIDEEGLLNWSDQTKAAYGAAHGEYSTRIKQYVEEVLVPERKTTTGHDVGIEFAGFIPDGNDKSLIGLTLSSGCKTCMTSFMSTLKVSNDVIGYAVDTLKAKNTPQAPGEISGIIVLANHEGSPSATFRQRPKTLRQDAAPV